MGPKWKQILILFVSFVTTVVSGFLVVMHFHHDPHWTPDRFGGLPVALACIPICAASYVVGCYSVNRWLHPICFLACERCSLRRRGIGIGRLIPASFLLKVQVGRAPS